MRDLARDILLAIAPPIATEVTRALLDRAKAERPAEQTKPKADSFCVYVEARRG